MENEKPKEYMTIKISTETGDIIKIRDEHEQDPTRFEGEEDDLKKLPGYLEVAKIYYAHSSPGCIFVRKSNGQIVKICR